MKRKVQEGAINRKLTAVVKGTHRALDRIEIPTHDWFLSPSQREIYQYEDENLRAFPADESLWSFFPHHSLKVPPKDIVLVEVGFSPDKNRHLVLGILPTPQTCGRR